MNQTASKPNFAMASHSAEGTELKSTYVPIFRLSSESQTQVLISYKVGYCGQIDMIIPSFVSPFTRSASLVGWVSTTLWYVTTGYQEFSPSAACKVHRSRWTRQRQHRRSKRLECLGHQS